MHDTYVLPDELHKGDYYYVHSNGSTIVIPCLDEDHFVLVKQFRYLNQKESLEFPGGGLQNDVGSVEVGKKTDIVMWDVDNYKQIPYYLGLNLVEKVIKNGILVYEK